VPSRRPNQVPQLLAAPRRAVSTAVRLRRIQDATRVASHRVDRLAGLAFAAGLPLLVALVLGSHARVQFHTVAAALLGAR
jgi:hypothetical protein